jgi:pyruvate,water dikinase
VRLAAAADAARYGGKTAALAVALRAGLPVPDGVALSPRDVTALLGGGDDAAPLRAQLERVAPPVAVRSSAIGEDAPDRSFAGQHATTLNARGLAEIRDAVARVGASAASLGASAYRRRHGIARVPPVAVLVQTMVPADVSGVMFTRDPVGGARVRVIEAAWGLGEAVVAGLVIPDHFRVALDGSVLASEPGEKDVEIAARAGGGVEERPVPAARARRACLGAARLARLAQLADACERVFGAAQDVEWAFASEALALLQSRPITTSSGRAISGTD